MVCQVRLLIRPIVSSFLQVHTRGIVLRVLPRLLSFLASGHVASGLEQFVLLPGVLISRGRLLRVHLCTLLVLLAGAWVALFVDPFYI